MDQELIFHEQYEGLVLCLIGKKITVTTQNPHISKLTKKVGDFLLKQVTRKNIIQFESVLL